MNPKPFFDQYLRDIRIPVLEYFINGNQLSFRWNNCVPEFNMLVRIYVSGEFKAITLSNRFSTISLAIINALIVVDPDYYVASMNMTGK